MLYRSSGTPFGSSPMLLPRVGIRCHEIVYGAFNSEIQNISNCRIVNQSNFCPARDRLEILCGGIEIILYI